jgi:hypothetical protein
MHLYSLELVTAAKEARTALELDLDSAATLTHNTATPLLEDEGNGLSAPQDRAKDSL